MSYQNLFVLRKECNMHHNTSSRDLAGDTLNMLQTLIKHESILHSHKQILFSLKGTYNFDNFFCLQLRKLNVYQLIRYVLRFVKKNTYMYIHINKLLHM